MSNDPNGEKPEDETMKCLLARLDGALEDDPNPLQPSKVASPQPAPSDCETSGSTAKAMPAQQAGVCQPGLTVRQQTQPQTQTQLQPAPQATNYFAPQQALSTGAADANEPVEAQVEQAAQVEQSAAAQAAQVEQSDEPALAVYRPRVANDPPPSQDDPIAPRHDEGPVAQVTLAGETAQAAQAALTSENAVHSAPYATPTELQAATSSAQAPASLSAQAPASLSAQAPTTITAQAPGTMQTSAPDPAQEAAMDAVQNPAAGAGSAFEAARRAVISGSTSATYSDAASTPAEPATAAAATMSPNLSNPSTTASVSALAAPASLSSRSEPGATTPSSPGTSAPPTAPLTAAANASSIPGQTGPAKLQLVATAPVASQSATAPQPPLKWYHNNTHVAIAAAVAGVIICAPLILLLGYKMGGGTANVIGSAGEKVEEQRQMDGILAARMTPSFGLGAAQDKRRPLTKLENKEEGRQLVVANVSPQLLVQPKLVRGIADGLEELPAKSNDQSALSVSTLRDAAPVRPATPAASLPGKPDRKPIEQPNIAAQGSKPTRTAVAMLERPAVTAVPSLKVDEIGETTSKNTATPPAPAPVPSGNTLAKPTLNPPVSKPLVSKTLTSKTLTSKTLASKTPELNLGLAKPAPTDVVQSKTVQSKTVEAKSVQASAVPVQPEEEKLHLPLAVLKPELTGKAGDHIPLSLRFEPYALLPERSFVMISGLPDNVKLGGGVRRGPGIWLVNAPDVPDAVLELSKTGTGSFEIVANLIGPDGSEISNARSRLIIEHFKSEADTAAAEPVAPIQAGITISPFTALKSAAPIKLAPKSEQTTPLKETTAVVGPADRASNRLFGEQPTVATIAPKSNEKTNSVLALGEGPSNNVAAPAGLTDANAAPPPAPPLAAKPKPSSRQSYAASDLMEPEISGPVPGQVPGAAAPLTNKPRAARKIGARTQPAAAEDVADQAYSSSNLMPESVRRKNKIPQKLASVLTALAKRSSGLAEATKPALAKSTLTALAPPTLTALAPPTLAPFAPPNLAPLALPTLTPLAEPTLAPNVKFSLAPSSAVPLMVPLKPSAKPVHRRSASAIDGSSTAGGKTITAMMQPRTGETLSFSQTAQKVRPIKQTKLTIPPTEISALIKRGQERIAIGDIALARLLFERAARGGSAQAAFSLAETYDPNLIWRLGAVGLSGNVQKARSWYLQAQKLDSRMQIGERLRALLGL